MKLWRNLAITGFCLTTGATGALAQTVSTPFALNNSVSFDGLTATITSLSCTSTVACATDNELEVTSLDRDDLQFEIVNSNPGSAIFAGTTGSTASETDTLTFTLSIVADPDYSHAIGTPSSVTTSATGWQAYSSCDPCSGVSATGSSVLSGSVAANDPLTGALPVQGSGTTASQVSYSGISSGPITTVANPFTIASTLTLTNSGQNATRLEFNAYALQLRTVPEPASATLFLLGLGGLAMVRQRRS